MKHITSCLLFFLLLCNITYSQVIYGEFWGLSGTLFVKTDKTVELDGVNGILQDSLLIFDTDTLVLTRYKTTDYFYLPSLRVSCGSFNSYFLKKEYWPNGNVKQDRMITYTNKGWMLHGETLWYNEDGTIEKIVKYRKGKLR